MWVVALAFMGLIASAPAHAESDGQAVMNWRANLPAASNSGQRRTYQPRRRYDAPTRVQTRQDDEVSLGLHMPDIRVAIPVPSDDARMKIALFGDSFAEALGFGFESDIAFRSDFTLRQRAVSSSGLVREDFHNWPKSIAAFLAENRDIGAIIIMMGLNDRQALRIGEVNAEPLSPEWREAYRQRVDAVLAATRAADVPVIWIGMPVVRLPKLSADLQQINELVRDRVHFAGHTYLDIADAFGDTSGAFSPTGPDVIGDIVRLRGPDGIHFTPAGQRKLAFFAERPLRRLLAERKAPSIASPTTPSPVGIVALPEPAALPASASLPAMPQRAPLGDLAFPQLPIDGLAIAMPAPRPAIGETRNLNEVRPAAQLMRRAGPGLQPDPTRQFFDRGLPPEPRAGRSDDHTWR